MKPRRGFILIFTCLALVILMGVAGIAVDFGRMQVGRNELQSFAEAAALAGASQLDGTAEGFTKASDAISNAANGPTAMKWDMATKAITNITVMFAKGLVANPDKPDAATWTEKPDSPSTYRFVKVVGAASLTSVFIPNSTTNLVASAAAGKVSDTVSLGSFTAIAPESGNQYVIEGDDPAVLAARVVEDGDPVSSDYSSYVTRAKGNGRRVVDLTIKKAAPEPSNETGEFFLLTPELYKNARRGEPVYAEYIGSAAQNLTYGKVVRLIQ